MTSHMSRLAEEKLVSLVRARTTIATVRLVEGQHPVSFGGMLTGGQLEESLAVEPTTDLVVIILHTNDWITHVRELVH